MRHEGRGPRRRRWSECGALATDARPTRPSWACGLNSACGEAEVYARTFRCPCTLEPVEDWAIDSGSLRHTAQNGAAPMAPDHRLEGSFERCPIRDGYHDRLGTQRHEILGWPEARAIPG